MATSAPITAPGTAPADLAVPQDMATQPQHTGLRRACAYLRRLLTPPPDDVPPVPLGTLALAVRDLVREWGLHVTMTEAPDGLLAQIVNDCPRLAPMVERLRREHPAVTARLSAAHERLDTSTPELAETVRELVSLLSAIERHRHGGGELLHRAYNVDLGLGD